MSDLHALPLRAYAGQTSIYQAGQTGTIWRVRQGVVRLVHQSGPSRLPVQIALPGDLIGAEALLGQPYQFSAEAFTDCELEALDPVPHGDLLGEVLLVQQQRSHDMVVLRSGHVLQRLSHLLRLLGFPWQGPSGVTGDQADRVRRALPALRDVAELVDAKTETVCRALAQLLPPRSRKSGPVRGKSTSRVAAGPTRMGIGWAANCSPIGVAA